MQDEEFDTAADFLRRRKDWLKVITVNKGPNAWDIALVIDGTYFGDYIGKKDMIEHYEEQLREIFENEDL